MNTLKKYIDAVDNASRERAAHLIEDLSRFDHANDEFCFLDMGAGAGLMSIILLTMFPGSRGTLVDPVDRFSIPRDLLDRVKGRFESISWGDISKLEDGAFDLVLSIDVLEHVPNLKSAFHQLTSFVKSGGFLYIQTPSAYPSPNWPTRKILRNRILGFLGKNNPAHHVPHVLSGKDIYDFTRARFTPLLLSEDYVVKNEVFCDFKPRVHALLRKTG